MPTPTPDDAQRQLCAKAVRSLGVGTATDIADYFRLPIQKVRLRLDELVEDGQVVAASVAGWDQPAFRPSGSDAEIGDGGDGPLTL